TYVIRTISEFHSVGFAESKNADCFAIHESDLLEIYGDVTLFPLEQFSKRVDMLSVNPATHAQHSNVLFTHKSLYSEDHCDGLLQSLSVCRSCQRPTLRRAFDFTIANFDPFVMYWK